jgi:DNA-binding transcriptional regulator YdaS (Cro superfamily)
MRAGEKFERYCKNAGVQKKWFAEQLGINRSQISQFCSGSVPLPKKFWVGMMNITKGEITFADLMIDFLKPFEFLGVKETKSKNKCEVYIKTSHLSDS